MILSGSHSTRFESFLIVRTKTGQKKKIFENQFQTSFQVGLEQGERAIGMLTAGISATHFQRHESTISRLLNRFRQTGNVATQIRQTP